MPGITMPPDASISIVPSGTSSDGPTAEIRSPSMSTSASRSTDRESMVSTVPSRKTTGAPGLTCTLASAPRCLRDQSCADTRSARGQPVRFRHLGTAHHGVSRVEEVACDGPRPVPVTMTDRTHDAVVVETPGQPPAVRRRDPPSPRPGEVTIRVSAAPIAPLDLLCATRHVVLRCSGHAVRPGRTRRRCGRAGDGGRPRRHPGVVRDLGRDGSGDGSMRAVAIVAEQDVVPLPGRRTRCWSPRWVCPRGGLDVADVARRARRRGAGPRPGCRRRRRAGRRAARPDRGRPPGAGRRALGRGAGPAPGASTRTRWSRSTTPTTSRPWPPGSGTRATGRWTSSSTRCSASRAPPPCASCASTAGSSTSAAPPARSRRSTSSTLRGQSLRVLGYTNNELTPDQRRDALLRVVDEAAAGRLHVAHEVVPLGAATERGPGSRPGKRPDVSF